MQAFDHNKAMILQDEQQPDLFVAADLLTFISDQHALFKNLRHILGNKVTGDYIDIELLAVPYSIQANFLEEYLSLPTDYLDDSKLLDDEPLQAPAP